eukprot:scaffold223302_cov15-Tisochrysis_lutea.AAC.1
MGWHTDNPENLDEKKCDRHQKGCLKGQHSRSANIVGCGPAGRPFPLKLPGPIFARQYGCGWAGSLRRSI